MARGAVGVDHVGVRAVGILLVVDRQVDRVSDVSANLPKAMLDGAGPLGAGGGGGTWLPGGPIAIRTMAA
ncbi:MAG: hypothetical protein ACK4NZ_09910 [Tsuneonella sp.]